MVYRSSEVKRIDYVVVHDDGTKELVLEKNDGTLMRVHTSEPPIGVYIPAVVEDSEGTVVPDKRFIVELDANGEIDDLRVEEI